MQSCDTKYQEPAAQTNRTSRQHMAETNFSAAALMLVVLLHASPAEPGLQPVLPLDMRQEVS